MIHVHVHARTVAAFVVGALLATLACARPTPATAIRDALAGARTACVGLVESGDPGAAEVCAVCARVDAGTP